ncbi:hypothetical protein ACFYZ9_39550 [Streptomyces sp. NPDC001691]|uniref:hypothetical protein n=1 Tax=Streptomyces sp. NPDC001691 TaxID=3364600 RepID=UPI0036CAF525
MVIDMADRQDATLANELTEAPRLPVWNELSVRADHLRRSLPPRPDDSRRLFNWWTALGPAQACRAVLLDPLDALCGHIAGRPSATIRTNCSPRGLCRRQKAPTRS